jgi:hypothetical protein
MEVRAVTRSVYGEINHRLRKSGDTRSRASALEEDPKGAFVRCKQDQSIQGLMLYEADDERLVITQFHVPSLSHEIAQQLVGAIRSAAKESGVETICLETPESPQNRPFLESVGFKLAAFLNSAPSEAGAPRLEWWLLKR